MTVVPGENPLSTGITVVADLSAIGGAVAQAFDDGDSDGTFTYTATVADGTAVGPKSITATIVDAEGRSGTATIALTVTAPPTEIWQIQGPGHLSPLDGQLVFGVEGVVTAVSSSGFWMTDPTPDDDDATSDGILVFRGAAAVGDLVTVNGRVDEFRPGGTGWLREPHDHRDRHAVGDRPEWREPAAHGRHRGGSAPADEGDRRRLDDERRGRRRGLRPAQ